MNQPITKKSEETKKRVRQAALELMSKYGFSEAKIKDICKKAGVSVGTFYSYFESKEDIIKEMCLESDILFGETVSKEISGRKFNEQVKIFIHYLAEFNTELGPDILGLLYTPSNGQFLQTRPMLAVLDNIISTGMEEGIIRSDLTVDNTSKQIFTVLRGVCFDWCVNNGSFNMERRMNRYIQLALEGLFKR